MCQPNICQPLSEELVLCDVHIALRAMRAVMCSRGGRPWQRLRGLEAADTRREALHQPHPCVLRSF